MGNAIEWQNPSALKKTSHYLFYLFSIYLSLTKLKFTKNNIAHNKKL